MIVPFETRLIEASTPEEEGELLARMVHTGLPPYVIHEAGDSLAVCVERMQPAIEEAGFKVAYPLESAYNFSCDPATPRLLPTDKGLHLDRTSTTFTTASVHHTTQGMVEVSLFEPTEQFLRRDIDILPGSTRGLFLEGQVDDTVLEPIRYAAVLRPGSKIVFRLGGPIPLAHDFTSTMLPRRSKAIDLIEQDD